MSADGETAATQMQLASSKIVHPVVYPVTEGEIAEARARYAAIAFDTSDGYEEGRKAIAHLRGVRTAIEKRRVELKADALDFGRRVDKAAKDLTALIEGVEAPLKERKAAVDDAAERARRAAEDAARVEAEAKAKAEREAEEARIAEEKRKLDEQRKLFEEQQRKTDAERAEREKAEKVERERVETEQKAERDRLAAERREIETAQLAIRKQQEAAARAEQERLAAIERERLAAEQAERDRVEAERRAAEAKAAAEAEAARLEAMKPDLERVTAWAKAVRDFSYTCPALATERAQEAIAWSTGRLEFIAGKLDEFVSKGGV